MMQHEHPYPYRIISGAIFNLDEMRETRDARCERQISHPIITHDCF